MAFTVADYIQQAKDDAYVDDDQISDNTVLRYFNDIYHELENSIVSWLREYYFRGDLSLQSLVASQNDYDLPIGTSDSNPSWVDELKKIFAVYVKYSNAVDADYYKAQQVDHVNLPKDLPFYWANQPPTIPIYILKWNAIQIFPTPSVAVSNWLKIDYARSDKDRLTSTTESELTIPWQYHKVIVAWCVYRIFWWRGMINEKNDAYNFYLSEKKRLMKDLANRFIKPTEWTIPLGLLNNYMY